MQLDETRISIRERTGLEVLDLALGMLRAFLRPCLTLLSIGVAPFILWNFLLTYWMPVVGDEFAPVDIRMSFWRYLWAQAILTFLQAPLACSLVTAFVGKAAFERAPSYREAWREVRSSLASLLWSQGIFRMAIPGSIALLFTDRSVSFHSSVELLLLGGFASFAALARMGRPFLPEIVLLEKNPYRSRDPDVVTAVRRNRHLHSLNGSELVVRWIAAALVCTLLFGSIYFTLFFAQGVFVNIWSHNTRFMLFVTIPCGLWTCALYTTLARYLNYLDQRIRYEGWEVELKLRAEARRLQAVPFAE